MNAPEPRCLSVVIVGGGASGILLAIHLLADPCRDLCVTLIEKSDGIGCGLAYSTQNPEHVLNVPARGMSAFPEDPDHFFRWLNALDSVIGRDSFAPRARYGQYLSHLLGRIDEGAGRQRLRVLNATCEAIEESQVGVQVRLADGSTLAAHAAVLAVGHEERQVRGGDLAVRAGSPADTPLDPHAGVLVLGSGLSMVDAWLTLTGRHHKGPVLVVSRNGRLPRDHAPSIPLELAADDVPLGTTMSSFLQWFRALVRKRIAAGGDWRDVVDGLRPFTQAIWQSWTVSSRRQFLTHVRPLWNIHRHRLPPHLFARLQKACRDGQLTLIAAEYLGIEGDKDGEGVIATIRRRGLRKTERLAVARVYDCGGVAVDVLQSSNPLIRQLVASGKARPDSLRIGLDVTADCAVLNAEGTPSRRIFAIGPLTRSQFLEIESVPEIRVQAVDLAKRLIGEHSVRGT